jgi:catechol 2,3-dioxygenase-like lactoylglutathione lyase family enzyme
MPQARFSHLALNVSSLARSEAFYLAALGPLGFVAADGEANRYRRLTNGADLVIVLAQVEHRFLTRPHHRKAPGLHHFALSVPDKADLDAMERHLTGLGVPLLGAGRYETGYRDGYCGLMFEDPDRITIEIAHHHPQGYYAA